VQNAVKQDAYIIVRPFASRPGFIGFIDLFAQAFNSPDQNLPLCAGGSYGATGSIFCLTVKREKSVWSRIINTLLSLIPGTPSV